MGRPPVGAVALTNAEKQRRYRERQAQHAAKPLAEYEARLTTAYETARELRSEVAGLRQQLTKLQRENRKLQSQLKPDKPPKPVEEQVLSLERRLKKAHAENRGMRARMWQIADAIHLNKRGMLTKAQCSIIDRALHPDLRRSLSDKALSEASQIWNDHLRKTLVLKQQPD